MRERLLAEIQAALRDGAYRFSEHALMEAADDELAISAVETALSDPAAEVLEEYPEDARGPSLLVLGWLPDRKPMHAVVACPPDVVIITV